MNDDSWISIILISIGCTFAVVIGTVLIAKLITAIL